MKINKATRHWMAPLFILFLLWLVNGCGSSTTVSQVTQDNSISATTASVGTAVVGNNIKVSLSTNRSEINVGDQLLITVSINCNDAGGDCITNSSGNLVFAAKPTEFQGGNTAPQSALIISANYVITTEATIAPITDSFTLAAGTPADSNASPVVSLAPGETTEKVVFTVTLTGAKKGTAIFSAQSFDTIASLFIDVVEVLTAPTPTLDSVIFPTAGN